MGLHEDEPIRDLCGLLEARGIKVLPLPVASDAFFGLSVAPIDGGPAVVVNTWDRISVERWIFSAAHELGHLILHLADYEIEAKEEAEAEEREANVFAAHFLMPNGAFQKEWSSTYGMAFVDRVLKVKRIFRVSYRTVLYRLAEGRKNKGEIWKAFQVDHKRRYGKTLLKHDEPKTVATDAFRASFPEPSPAQEPERLSQADFVEDRLSRLVRKAIDQSAITLARGAEILGLSLPEMQELSTSWVG
jgi:Zn-dependent peptidase ImmA (M78 family)